jgi:hypothetical protein
LIVKPGGYEAVVADVEHALTMAGLRVTRRPASPWFEVPPKVLAAAGGLDRRSDLPRRLVGFTREGLNVLVYPSAVTLSGRSDLVAAGRSAVVRCLPFSEAYLTTTKEAEEAEDWLRELARRPFVQASDFEPIDALLTARALPSDDWDMLFRLRFQVEHEVLARYRGAAVREA